MERIKSVVRVCKAASKRPHSRTNTDINHIAAETQSATLLTREGPAVHRELCHVLQALNVSQMQSVRLPGEFKSGIMVYVLQGRVQIRTRSKAAFEHGFECSSNSSNSSPGASSTSSPGASSTGSGGSSSPDSSSGGKKAPAGTAARASSDGTNAAAGSAGAAGASEADLRALFDSIDKDGSGAIDVEELQYALSVMGIDKSPAEVQELMDSVDKDGSGQLEFEEFVLILTTKLGVGGGQRESAWQELPDGSWSMEVEQGGAFGEAALLKGLAQEGLLLALEDCSLLTLDAASYGSILAHGFDGQLNAKLAILKSSSILATCISNRSDIRGLAYAAASESMGWAGQLYAAGQAATALYVIQEGSCRIVTKTRAADSSTAAGASTTAVSPSRATDSSMETSTDGATLASGTGGGGSSASTAAAVALLSSPRHGLHSPRSRLVERRVEVALLGPGDLAGEASALGHACHASSAVVCSAHILVLRLDLQDLRQLLHPGDMQHLAQLLQLREEERQQRLHAAAVTTSAVLKQQQHVKAAALSASGITAGSDAVLALPGEGGGGRQAAAVSSAGGQKQAGLPLPLSTAASVAAAIAAAGGSPRKDLPSRIEREKVTAVQQLLEWLTASNEEIETSQSLAMSAAVAALAAAHADPTGSGGSSSSSGLRRSTCTSSQMACAAAAAASSQHGALRHSSAIGNGSCSSLLRKGRRTCSPPSCRHSSPPGQQHTSAAELLLPPSLQRKLAAVLHRAQTCEGTRSNALSSSSKNRRHGHSTQHAGSVSTPGVAGIGAGTNRSSSGAGCSCSLGGGQLSSRNRGSSPGQGSTPSSPRVAASSESGNRHRNSGSLTARAYHSAGGCQTDRAAERHLQCYTSRQVHSSSECRSALAAASRGGWLAAQHVPAAGDFTSDGTGAVLQHSTSSGSSSSSLAQQSCCTCSAAGAASSSGEPAAAGAAAGSLVQQRQKPRAACDPARRAISPRATKQPQSAPHLSKPPSPGPGSPRLKPLGGCAAPQEGSHACKMQVQGFSAASHADGHAEGDGSAAAAAAAAVGQYQAGQQQHVQRQLAAIHQQQGVLCCPATDGFFLTDAPAWLQDTACMPPVSQEAAAAVSAAVTAAEAMRASNSIDLCINRAASPCTSRTMHSHKPSLGIVSVELAEGLAAIGAASMAGSRLVTPRSPAAAAAAGAGALRSSRAVSAMAALQSALTSAGQVTSRHTSSCVHCTDGAAGAAGGASSRCSQPATMQNLAAAAAAAVAAAGAGGGESVAVPLPRTSRTSHSRPVPVRVISAVDASVWQAAEAAAGCTSWSLGVRLLQSPRGTVDATLVQREPPAQQIAADNSPVACQNIISDSSSNVKAQDAQPLQQHQQGCMQQQGTRTKAASPPVPRLQLQKLRNVDLGLVSSSAVLSNMKSSIPAAAEPAASNRPGALPAAAVQQKIPKASVATGGTAGTTSAAVAPLPSWRSALTTRWQPGGRFSKQADANGDNNPLQGSLTSRL
eukprot:jgi/Sobl393_1/1515/SZX72241.1